MSVREASCHFLFNSPLAANWASNVPICFINAEIGG